MTRIMWIGVKAAALTAGLVAATLLAGCGSSNSTGIVDVRTVDAVSDGGSATIEINNGTVSGAQAFFSVTSTHYMQPGTAIVTFSFSNITTTFQSAGYPVANGDAYTAYLVGDVSIADPTKAGYPQAVFLQDDQGGAPAGQVLVRFVDAASDIPSATLLVNGSVVQSGMQSGSTTSYAIYSGTSPSVSVTNGAGTTLLAASPIALSSGHSYTLVLDEPVMGTGNYRIDTVQDH